MYITARVIAYLKFLICDYSQEERYHAEKPRSRKDFGIKWNAELCELNGSSNLNLSFSPRNVRMLKKLGSEGKNRNQPIHRPTLTDYLDLDFNVKIVISKDFVYKYKT